MSRDLIENKPVVNVVHYRQTTQNNTKLTCILCNTEFESQVNEHRCPIRDDKKDTIIVFS